MPSELTFDATENFRKRLLVRNLEPYKEGYKGNESPGSAEFSIKDLGVVDSTRVTDLQVNEEAKKRAFISNQYGPEGGYKDLIDIQDIRNKIEKRESYYTFVSSTYNAFNLLTSFNPTGTNGSLSQDSALAQIAGNQLKTEFEYRIAEETYQQTLGRINVIDALSDPFDAIAIATGNEQAIESDWKISVPDNIIGKGLDLISRISGVYSPYSWIPGSYFTKVEEQSSINQASRGDGEYSDRGTLLPEANKRSSELFISNSGRGQTKRLFKSLSLNVFAPDYTDNNRAFGLKAPSGNYYVGSKTQDPKDIVAPPNELPVDQFGNRVRTPVRGYSELGKLYEGNFSFKFGLNGTKFLRVGTATNSSYDAPRLQGGFTWTSLDGVKSAGRFVSQGGGLGSVDSNFESNIQSSFDAGVSTQYDFKKGSILDDTQKLIDSAEGLQGDARLQHVGNAINQVSKVFSDGTREITKGSRVYKYEDQSTGEIKGMEYCRVFTKDIPYFSNSELQKEDGMTNQNRRFQFSVLDNTYNLNIAPFRDDDSSNIQADKVKKYMFSIENLAWRTSSKPGFTYSDLPVCERGPSGGRIMWFPPYDMKVSETNSTNWTSNEFLGRPEPVYTYNNTTRQGSLSWKIVVDHPSILNAIVDKELAGQNSQRVNDIVDSFFAGCRKYDIYELAQRFPQFTLKDIYEIVTETTDIKTYENFSKDIERIDLTEKDPVIEEYTPEVQTQDYEYEFYFDNDVPGPRTASSTTTTEEYANTLSTYIAKKETYYNTADSDKKIQVLQFFESFLINGEGTNITEKKTQELVVKIKAALDKGATINMKLVGSASAPNSVAYNDSLSKRRIDAVKKYLFSFFDLSKYEDRFSITEDPQGEQSTATPGGGEYGSFNCTEELSGNSTTYSVNAMACRAVVIKTIEEIPSPPNQRVIEVPPEIITETITGKTETIRKQETKRTQPRDEIAKIIVKKLLTECDYFNMMREETPRVYEGIKEKIKYFQPVFHSMTPEGLNSRLTFLQQCLRPGDTIPVIGEDGKPREGDVKNTAFGAPPICVLRIGDFYHSKIAIQQMSINYEPLTFDLNPEGIGVQPMIADINMSFYFIGGQGIKEPVSRLQNALSFNYYGNTEVYDNRSTATEDRSELNRQVLDAIEDANDFSLTENGQVERSEEAGDTLGVITDTQIGEFLIGDINYNNIVNDFVSKSQSYTQNVLSTLDTIRKEQSSIGMYYLTQTRNYTDGYTTGYLDGNDELFTNIFGKPSDLQNRINELSLKLNEDVDNDTNPFLTDVTNQNFKRSDIKKFRKNIKSYNTEKTTDLGIFLNIPINDLVNSQTEFVRVNDKLNLVVTETDGFKNKKGGINILELSATTEVDVSSSQSNTQEELLADIQTVGFDLQAFYDQIFEDGGMLPPKDNLYSGFLSGEYDTEPQTRFCTISYYDMLNDPEYIIGRILGEELKLKDEWVRYVEKIIYGTEPIPSSTLLTTGTTLSVDAKYGLVDVYEKLSFTDAEKFFDLENNNNVKKFTLYEPFNPDKVRNFTYIQKPQEQADDSKVNYFRRTFTSGQNSGPLNEYNEKYSFNL
jgi:outer membrane protein OmpA-like peptidoglycan-associated protein